MERLAVDDTLNQVLDAAGELRRAREVLNQHYDRLINFRFDVEEAVVAGHPPWRCPYCAAAVVVRCQYRRKADQRSAGAFHFRHKHRNANCPGSRASRLTPAQILAAKYHGQREGALHRRMKQLLLDSLCADSRFTDVRMEKTWRGSCQPDQWRRPDVSARFQGQPVVFEVQLSTTFITVMAERRLFYRNEGVCLVWVVAEFDPAWTTLAHESAFYPNNSNIFVVSDHTRSQSLAQSACRLEVVWLQPVIERGLLIERTRRAEVEVGSLSFDVASARVFYVDVEGERQKLETQLMETREQFLAEEQSARTSGRDARQAEFRQAFERCWMEGLAPALSQADYLRRERDWRTLHHSASLLGLQLPGKRHEIGTAINAIYSVRDAQLGKLVGFRLNDLVKLAHFIHTSHKPLLWPFRQALAAYGRAKLIEELDHTGRWRAKVADYKQAILRDAPEYRVPDGLIPLLSVLFPQMAPALRDSPVAVLKCESARRRALSDYSARQT